MGVLCIFQALLQCMSHFYFYVVIFCLLTIGRLQLESVDFGNSRTINNTKLEEKKKNRLKLLIQVSNEVSINQKC